MHKGVEKNLGLELFRSQAYLMINKNLIKMLGTELAIYLENLVDKYKYYQDRGMLEDDCFFLTHKDQQEQLGLTEYQIRRRKKELVELGLISIIKKGVPCKEFYKIHFDVLLGKFMQQTRDGASKGDSTSGLSENGRELEEIGGNEISGEGETFNTLTPRRTKNLTVKRTKNLTVRRTKNLMNIKDNIYKENIYKENNNIIGEIVIGDEEKKVEKEKQISPKKEKNLKYIPIAKRLAEIIQTNKNIKISPSKLNNWADPIRKLHTIDKVSISRIEAALDWYSQNIGGQYIPVIESGNSLRDKFIRLEDAIRRSGGTIPSNKPSEVPAIHPKKLIQQELGSLAPAFEKNCYALAKQRLPAPASRDSRADLVQALIQLHHAIRARQKQMSKETFKLFPQYGPISLMQTYIQRLPDAPWSEWKQRRLFDIDAGWFQNFCTEYAFENGESAIHPLSGKSLRN